MTDSKQLRLLPESRDQRAAALHRAQVTTCAVAQVREVAGTVVRHGVMLGKRAAEAPGMNSPS